MGFGLVSQGVGGWGGIPGKISYIEQSGQLGNGLFRESWRWGTVGRAEHGCSGKL